jgi:hypothetical protein
VPVELLMTGDLDLVLAYELIVNRAIEVHNEANSG